jgi:hypothetical protein
MRLPVSHRTMVRQTIFATALTLTACGLTQTQDSRGRGKSSARNEETTTDFHMTIKTVIKAISEVTETPMRVIFYPVNQ